MLMLLTLKITFKKATLLQKNCNYYNLTAREKVRINVFLQIVPKYIISNTKLFPVMSS